MSRSRSAAATALASCDAKMASLVVDAAAVNAPGTAAAFSSASVDAWHALEQMPRLVPMPQWLQETGGWWRAVCFYAKPDLEWQPIESGDDVIIVERPSAQNQQGCHLERTLPECHTFNVVAKGMWFVTGPLRIQLFCHGSPWGSCVPPACFTAIAIAITQKTDGVGPAADAVACRTCRASPAAVLCA